MPKSVNIAIKLIWSAIAIGVIAILVGKITGINSSGEFIAQLIISGLYCIIPYKLANRSNGARYTYLIVTVISVLMILGLGNEMFRAMSKAEIVSLIVTFPLYIYALYLLFFNKEAAYWFKNQ